MYKISVSILLLIVSLPNIYSQAEIYPVMPGVKLNPDFSVKINDGSGFENVPVQDIVDVCFVHFANQGSVQIEITVNQSIHTWRISPERLGIVPEVVDSIMTFTLTDTAKLIVLINDNAGNHTLGLDGLCIFADAPERDVPLLADPDVVNIMEYGVDSAGNILATNLIQKAFNDYDGLNKIIYFPPGIYKSGMLHMRAKQSLYLAPGAVLMGSDLFSDYAQIPGEGNSSEHYLLGSWNSDEIRVYGRGIINGNGTALRLQDSAGADYKTHLIQFQGSDDISIEGVVCLDAGSWSIEPIFCDNIYIRDVKVLSDLRYYDAKINTDGIDMNKCRHVLVEDCLIWSGDDAITPKQDNTYNNIFPLRNVNDHTYNNIVVFTRKCAVKVGSETYNKDFEFFDMEFRNFDVVYADRAICIWSDYGALVHFMTFKNFNIEEIGNVDAKQSHIHCRIDGAGNTIKNIDFINIKAREPAPLGSTFNGDNLNSTVNGKLVQYYNIKFTDYTIGGVPVLSLDDVNAKFNLQDDLASADPGAFSFYASPTLGMIQDKSNIKCAAYPNPMQESCKIEISLEKRESVKITVRNITGQVIDEVLDEQLTGGIHSFKWQSSVRTEGVFLISILTESIQESFRMIKY